MLTVTVGKIVNHGNKSSSGNRGNHGNDSNRGKNGNHIKKVTNSFIQGNSGNSVMTPSRRINFRPTNLSNNHVIRS